MSRAETSQVAETSRDICPILYTARYRYRPGTMMTIDGTVTDILGYPLHFIKREAKSPAVIEPAKAATAAGQPDRSTSSSLRVLATAPMIAAEEAMRPGLLNMREKPKTPAKLAANLRTAKARGDNARSAKSAGCRFSAMDITQPVTVAMIIIFTA